eukprot:1591255-Amphidinium_carterae.1
MGLVHQLHIFYAASCSTFQKSIKYMVSDIIVLVARACGAVQASLVFSTEYIALQKVCLDCTWQLAWYELDNSYRSLPCIAPEYVRVLLRQGQGESKTIWPKTQQKRGKHVIHPFLASCVTLPSSSSSTTNAHVQPLNPYNADDDNDVDMEENLDMDIYMDETTTLNSALLETAADWDSVLDVNQLATTTDLCAAPTNEDINAGIQETRI